MTKAIDEYNLYINQVQSKVDQIKTHPIMVQILADSFGGIMYNVANLEKYNTTQLLELWNNLTPSEQDASGGIISGAINFIKGGEY